MLTEPRPTTRARQEPAALAEAAGAARQRMWGGVLLAVFVALAVVTAAKAFKGQDQSIDDSLNRFALHDGGITSFLKAATQLGEPTVALGVGLLAAVLFHAFKRRNSAYFVAASVIGAYGIAYVAKKAVNRHRPVWDGAHTVVSDTGPSFPSGHATGSTALATVLVLAAVPLLASAALRRAAVALLVLFAATMVISRPVLGVHFPTDVLAGAFLGVGWTLVCASVLRPGRDRLSAG